MRLIEQLKFEEGLRLDAYRCTEGALTIGYGHNLDKAPMINGEKIPHRISKEFAEELLAYDVGLTMSKLRTALPRIDEFDKARRDAFFNMAFQLGVNGFMRFERMIAAAIARDWPTAHKEALNSNWAKQVPNRAKRVANQILTGKYYEVPA